MLKSLRTALTTSRGRLVAMLTTLSLTFAACGAINLFSVSDDAGFGRQMDAEIQGSPQEYPILNNEQLRGYVQSIVDKIMASPSIKYRGTFPYKVTLINDDKTINAFCTPGGYIYVYTGLLKFIDNEATLAGILGHEVAHAEERHGTEHMTTAMGYDIALQVALGKNSTELTKIAGNAAVLLATLKNSRDDEIEADTRSFTYLQSTSYWPGAIKYFFDKMEQRGARSGGVLAEWTSTHPTSESRTENVNKLLRENQTAPPTPASLMTDNYRTAMRSLR